MRKGDVEGKGEAEGPQTVGEAGGVIDRADESQQSELASQREEGRGALESFVALLPEPARSGSLSCCYDVSWTAGVGVHWCE